MSTRQMRKLRGGPTLPPPDSESESEFCPLYSSKMSSFSELVVPSSESEEEHKREQDSEEESVVCKTSKNEKNKKRAPHPAPDEVVPSSESEEEHRREQDSEEESVVCKTSENKKRAPRPAPDDMASSSKSEKKDKTKIKKKSKRGARPDPDEDEVERSLREVNELLGEPGEGEAPYNGKLVDKYKLLFSVNGRGLYYEDEFNRRFRVVTPESRQRSRNTTRPYIVPPFARPPENKPGWRMTRIKTPEFYVEDDSIFFVVEHFPEYQKAHKRYILSRREVASGNIDVESLKKKVHIEGLLDLSDHMFRLDEITAARSYLEMILGFFQYKAHELFNWSDQRVRLPYEYATNRPIHVALLRYTYIASTRGCHRTALEMCKLLLNLDPNDPLGVTCIMDVMALRARELAWLVRFADYFRKRASGCSAFGVIYSCGLAHFLLDEDRKETDHSTADAVLQQAISEFPYFAKVLMEELKRGYESFKDHELFTKDHSAHGVYHMSDTMKLAVQYIVKTVAEMWRERSAESFFRRNVEAAVKRYDEDDTRRSTVRFYNANAQNAQNTTCPAGMLRHLHVMRHMSHFLIEWDYNALPYFSPVFDPHPLPQTNIDEYNYRSTESRIPTSLLYSLVSSIYPEYYNQ